MKINKITCPNCATSIAVGHALIAELEANLRKDLEAQYAERINEDTQKEIHQVKQSLKEKYEMEMRMLQSEIEERKTKIRFMEKRELELMNKEQKLEEEKSKMDYLLEKQKLEVQRDAKEAGKKEAIKDAELKMMEYEKTINDLKKQATEMKRKSEQGSMQLQGEVMEQAIEQMLKLNYPQDEILEIGKGQRGADVVQKVRNNQFQICGSILYECKRTKSFSKQWLAKLKEDQRRVKAELAILVTQALPKDCPSGFMEMEGVLIVDYKNLENLVYIVRKFLLRIAKEKNFQVDRTNKKELVYEFFTSAQFKHLVDAILEGFKNMKDQIEAEKRAMKKQWAVRENIIERVMDTTIELYGTVKGIAGPEIGDLGLLELAAAG